MALRESIFFHAVVPRNYPFFLEYHKIMEWFGLEGTSMYQSNKKLVL